jgi:COP9 signalosome complex subunit 1
VLCALASLPRSALKTQILENSTFGVYVEQEPYVRELVEAYLSSNFKTVLELLNRYSVRRLPLTQIHPRADLMVCACSRATH